MNFLNILNGYKTYILVAFGLALWLGQVFHLWTVADVSNLFELLAILGVATFRSAVNKI